VHSIQGNTSGRYYFQTQREILLMPYARWSRSPPVGPSTRSFVFDVKSQDRWLIMFWLHKWEFCRAPGCRERVSIYAPLDRFSAREWLKQSQKDVLKMLHMRTLLSQERARDLSGMSDEEVIDQIAELLVSGCLHIHGQPVRPVTLTGGGSQGSTTSAKTEAEKPVPFPLSERRSRMPTVSSRERAVDPDQPTFSSNTDFAAQAATLVAAAHGGAAACHI
jgi:hypothetical protein